MYFLLLGTNKKLTSYTRDDSKSLTDQVRPEYTGCTKHTEVALLPLFEPIRKAHAVVIVTVMSFSFSDDWWGKAENYSYEAVYSYMLHSLQEKRLPQTYGLFLDETLIGIQNTQKRS